MIRTMHNHPHLRAVPGAIPEHAPYVPGMPLQVDWERMLRDLTACGVLRITLSNSAVRWVSTGEPWSARTDGAMAQRDSAQVEMNPNLPSSRRGLCRCRDPGK